MPPGDRSAGGMPTMRQVAKHAGVSPMTVSRALHGDPRVAPATLAKVREAVNALGYRRNEVARSLRLGGATGLIGLLVTNLANPFYSQLAMGVEAVVGEHGMRFVLGNTGDDVDRERQLVGDLSGQRVDGMIVVPAGSGHGHLDPDRLNGTPVVLAARPPSGAALDCVLVDDFNGSRAAVVRLIEGGHRRIGFLGLPPSVWTGSERFRGFSAALAEAGLELDDRLVRRSQTDVAAAENAARDLLALPEPPTALFSANNRNMIGAFRAVTATGADVALAGFDDFELADMLGLPLTVVAYDPAEVGRQAARLLLDRMGRGTDAPDAPPRRVVIPTRVVAYGT